MLKHSLSFILLSLFAPVEKALEIEGDLIEQAQTRGKAWFVTHVMLTTLVLLRQAFLADAIYICLFSYAIYELIFKIKWWGIRPVQIYLATNLDLSAVTQMLIIKGLWFGLALIIGATIVRFLPKFGFQVVIGAIVLALVRIIILEEIAVGVVLIFGVLPLLLGSVLAHLKNLDQPDRFKRVA